MSKTARFLVALLSLAAALFAQEPRTEKPRTYQDAHPGPRFNGKVTIACWNIEWFPAGPAKREDVPKQKIQNHVEAAAKIINEENPVILVASEIRNLEAAKMLNKALKKPYPYIAVTDYDASNSHARESDKNRQEHALFSRIPWLDAWEVDFVGSLPKADDRPSRGYIGATFKVDGQTLTLFAVHPKANYIRAGEDEAELTALHNVERRERASRYLLEDIRKRKLNPLKDRIVVMGDFNVDVYTERFKGDKTVTILLQAGFYNSLDNLVPAKRVTIPAKAGEPWPDTTFDYILTSVGLGKLAATVIQRGTSTAKGAGPGQPGYASDHYMVKVLLPTLQPESLIDFVEMSKRRQDWPASVLLRKSVSFPVFIAGKESGSLEATVGTPVKLVEVQPDANIRVELNGAQAVIPAADTDFAARVIARRDRD